MESVMAYPNEVDVAHAQNLGYDFDLVDVLVTSYAVVTIGYDSSKSQIVRLYHTKASLAIDLGDAKLHALKWLNEHEALVIVSIDNQFELRGLHIGIYIDHDFATETLDSVTRRSRIIKQPANGACLAVNRQRKLASILYERSLLIYDVDPESDQ
jgi:hypothetical protein